MEADILKFICSSQGAVDAEDLMFNLFPGESTTEVISNQSKFALCSSGGGGGRQRVVARTGLKLCRKKDCPGSCGGLHLCKNFLYSGSCHLLLRRCCGFPHELHSDYNQRLLVEHELEGLSREELCTLLLQSDNTMLPSICHDYNNGDGEFGRCASGVACERLHVCEKFLTQSCSCSRAHDFFAPQPMKSLYDKKVPDCVIQTLKSVYANREALRCHSRGGAGRGGHGGGDRRGSRGYRGRGGNRGNRGFRGGRGSGGNYRPQQAAAHGDNQDDIDGLDLYTEDGLVDGERDCHSSCSDVSDARSDSGLSTAPKQWNRGRGWNRGYRGTRGGRGILGTHPAQIRNASGEIWSEFGAWNPYQPSRSKSPLQNFNSSSSDVSVNADNEAGGEGGKKKQRSRSRSRARGGNEPGLRRASAADVLTSAGGEGGNGGNEPRSRPWNRPVKDKTNICMYYIKGYCKHEDKCFKAHDKMPYRWQVQEGDVWNALPDNETIEKEYCDPSSTYSSGSPPVHFDTMTRGENKVRRLATVNSLVEPNFIHTTEWLWYWQDEFGKWNQYGSDSIGKKSSDINSATLEQKFLDNPNDVVEFSAGSQSYSLSFQDMIQTNKRYGTKRLVSRRPLFVSAADVRTKKVKRPPANSSPVPNHWDKTQIPPTGFSRVVVPRTSDEFQRLETLFRATLRGFDIIKIERIQNKALWEVFQWQKNQMKNNNNGREVEEKKLFHGTDPKHTDAICLNNFDWRICGVNGTAYGKGSYFARDAKYSHSYTGQSDVKTMFVTRVLVGSYTKGESSFVRPPSKDGGDINFYDSCVNDVTNPSIFVVFEKHQIYPEYLLQYKSADPLVDSLSQPTVSVQAPKPTVSVQAPKPVAPKPPVYKTSTSSYQASTSSYQPSTSSYQSSTSSYRPTTSSYQSSTSLYQPSTSSYQSSTLSYRPTTSSYQPSTSSYKPSTSSYRASTSSLYQTSPVSQSTVSTPSPSKPVPKKNDSCVIA